jgi:hypothetical protein
MRERNLKTLIQKRADLLAKNGTDQAIEETGKQIKKEIDGLVGGAIRETNADVVKIKDAFLNKFGSQESYFDLDQGAQAEIKVRGLHEFKERKNLRSMLPPTTSHQRTI